MLNTLHVYMLCEIWVRIALFNNTTICKRNVFDFSNWIECFTYQPPFKPMLRVRTLKGVPEENCDVIVMKLRVKDLLEELGTFTVLSLLSIPSPIGYCCVIRYVKSKLFTCQQTEDSTISCKHMVFQLKCYQSSEFKSSIVS